jgi:hypothetical protein
VEWSGGGNWTLEMQTQIKPMQLAAWVGTLGIRKRTIVQKTHAASSKGVRGKIEISTSLEMIREENSNTFPRKLHLSKILTDTNICFTERRQTGMSVLPDSETDKNVCPTGQETDKNVCPTTNGRK